MCLVAIEKMPKLQTACTTMVANGMVVLTETEEVKNARKAMLEFLLTNHPLDCPVCDKGGECELQDAVFRYGAAETRFMETKMHHEERQFSNLVYYDWPRCILCYRCVRVCDEGLDVNAYGIGFRGAHSEIIPNQGEKLECEECGMCIDICPVGRAHQRHLSLQNPPLGIDIHRHHLQPLRRWLQDHAGGSQQRDHSRQQSRPLGLQW